MKDIFDLGGQVSHFEDLNRDLEERLTLKARGVGLVE